MTWVVLVPTVFHETWSSNSYNSPAEFKNKVQIIERDLDVVESCCEAASVFCVSCSLIEPVLLYWCGGMHWLR